MIFTNKNGSIEFNQRLIITCSKNLPKENPIFLIILDQNACIGEGVEMDVLT